MIFRSSDGRRGDRTKVIERFFEFTGADIARAEDHHADAVLEFPQSGERFEGRDTFTEWRSQYPVAADDMRYRLLRVTARDDFAAPATASYDRGENWMFGVQLLDFRDDKVIRERIYVTEGWEAPEWRAKWRSATRPTRRPDDVPANRPSVDHGRASRETDRVGDEVRRLSEVIAQVGPGHPAPGLRRPERVPGVEGRDVGALGAADRLDRHPSAPGQV